MAIVHGHSSAALVDLTDCRQIAEIEFWIDAVCVQIESYGNDIQIASTLTIAEQGALDALRSSHQAKFRSRDTRAAVIVRVQGDDG